MAATRARRPRSPKVDAEQPVEQPLVKQPAAAEVEPDAGDVDYGALGIADATGLQRMLRAGYGYAGPIDNKFGDASWAAFAAFLTAQVGHDVVAPPEASTWRAIGAWLRTMPVGYGGKGHPGPAVRAALQRASALLRKAF